MPDVASPTHTANQPSVWRVHPYTGIVGGALPDWPELCVPQRTTGFGEARVTHLNAWHDVPASCWRLVVLPVAVLVAGCGGDTSVAAPAEFNVRFVATNDLLAPVTILVDGSPYAILSNGKSVNLSLSSKARVTWTSAKPADANGQMIPDQIGEVNVAVTAINGVLDITNVIDDQTYITASIFNHTASPVSIGVYDGTSVSCASQLPGGSQNTSGFTQTGYYRLLSSTQFRAYRTSNCTGEYIAWPASDLLAFEPKSGRVMLTLTSAP